MDHSALVCTSSAAVQPQVKILVRYSLAKPDRIA